jgi:hypothetical protein
VLHGLQIRISVSRLDVPNNRSHGFSQSLQARSG